MNDNLRPFVFDGHNVRVVMRDNEPWFVAKDVCQVLAISKYRDALGRLDNDERGLVSVDTLGGTQQPLFTQKGIIEIQRLLQEENITLSA